MKQNQQPATNTSPRNGVDRRPRDVTEARLVDHSVTADVRAGRPPQAKSGLWFAILLTAFEVGASIAIFAYAVDHGASDVAAYLWACLGPLIGAVAYLVRTHDLSGASIAILAFNALSALIAMIGRTDATMLLYKDSFATGIVGLIFAVSLCFDKPLAYWFGQRFAGGGTHEGDDWWEQMWHSYPTFRRAQRVITMVWAVTLLVEAIVKAIVIKLNTYQTAFVWDQILPVVAFVVAMTLTLRVAQRSWAEGVRRRAPAGHEATQDGSSPTFTSTTRARRRYDTHRGLGHKAEAEWEGRF